MPREIVLIKMFETIHNFFSYLPRKMLFVLVAFFVGFGMWLAGFLSAQASVYSITPEVGANVVGSTFDVSVMLDTQGQTINALQMDLQFPADKLQLVSPSVGNSIIEVYTSPPRYDNTKGTVQIIGGIPNGINTNKGLVAKLTFRVKSVGQANLRFAGDSQVLLNDGHGTDSLSKTNGAVYTLELPPSQGPVIISSTHPNQDLWYNRKDVGLSWDAGLPVAEGYSYMISDDPADVPDDVSEGNKNSVEYKSVANGIHYFHIKAMRDGKWGGISRYSIRVDVDPPADFRIEVSPSERTFITKPMLQFSSSDALSGFDRFELKIVPLKIDGRTTGAGAGNQVDNQADELFTEVQSPFQTPELLFGSYEIVVRAYDKAGNTRDVAQRLEITNSSLWFIGPNGITLLTGRQIGWGTVIPILIGLLLLLILIALLIYHWHKYHKVLVADYRHPENIAEKMAELEYYRKKYGKIVTIILLSLVGSGVLWLGIGNLSISSARAEGLTPPVIGVYSDNIKDDELFYISGRTTEPDEEVVIHLQSLVDGQSFDFKTTSNKVGDWSYQNNTFLPGGKYIIWTHSKSGSELSAPSPQVTLDVKPIAVNWGGSRITYQTIYISLIIILGISVILLVAFIATMLWLIRKKRRQLQQIVRLAEEGLRFDFMALRKDIEAELALVQRAVLGSEMAGEANARAEQLRQDLKNIELIISREAGQTKQLTES